MKAIRTDGEIECPRIDAGLRARGLELATLPEKVTEDQLAIEMADVGVIIDLLCADHITGDGRATPRLRGIVKYGSGD